jgi:hypothetical protein
MAMAAGLRSYPSLPSEPPVFVTPGRSRWLALLSAATVVLFFALAVEIATHVPFFGAGSPLFMWRYWCFQPLILGTAAPLLILLPAHIPVAIRRVPQSVKNSVVLVAFVVTAVSLALGLAGWHSRAHIRPELLAAAGRLTPPAGFTAVGRPETGVTPHAAEQALPATWQLWAPTAGASDACAALLAAYGRLPGWQVDHGGSACWAIRRSGRVATVLKVWTASDLRIDSAVVDLSGQPREPGITAEVGPNDGYLP